MNPIEKAFEINDIPELHDRIIAGTALKAGVRLITDHITGPKPNKRGALGISTQKKEKPIKEKFNGFND